MTKTRTIDNKGNVSYEVRDGNEVIGYIRKGSGYYRAELPNGNGTSVKSINKAEETIALWRRLAG
jgi:hypothetical protein